MPFNSLKFILFFLLFVLIYYFVGQRYRKHLIALAGSYVFYVFAGMVSFLFLVLITCISYTATQKLKTSSKRRPIVYASITTIVVLLILSKYLAEIIGLIVGVNDTTFWIANSIVLPIGISFYALQAISLIIEVATKRFNQPLSFSKVALFLSFFPQSLAGPIHRPQELIPQFSISKKFDAEATLIGVKTLLFGFFLKLVGADKIALVIAPVLSKWGEVDGLTLLIAASLYSLQIYFDFWGYSLIAIGLGRILGYQIKLNFRHPYSATSLKEFWHRWHISLSQWMRDYVYIPIGGRRKGYLNFSVAILVTFLVSGIWHGISFNFILWGAIHALLYLIEDRISRSNPQTVHKLPLAKYRTALKCILLFILISFTWLIFRTENLGDLGGILGKILFEVDQWSPHRSYQHYFSGINLFYVMIALLTFHLSRTSFLDRKISEVPDHRWQRITDSTFTCICLTAIIFLGDIGGQEFLYFRF